MRWNLSKEDFLLGIFIVLGISYPFLTALLIFLQDLKERRQGLEELRAFYRFVLGLEECTKEKAKQVSIYVDEGLLNSMGGEEGLLNACTSNRSNFASARAEEKEIGQDFLVVDLVKKEKGMTQRLLRVRIGYQKGEEGIKIKEVRYEKGD